MRPIRVVYRKYDGSLHWHTELVTSGAEPFGQVRRAWLARVPAAWPPG